MKRHNQLLSLILVFSLALAPIQQAHAFSWSEAKSAVSGLFSRFADNEEVRRFIPLAVVLGFMGMSFFFAKRFSNVKEVQIGASTLMAREGTISGAQVVQPQVYSQTNSDGGGGASCGYQAVLRSCQIVAAIANGNTDLKKKLKGSQAIQTYFRQGSSQGKWRAHIVQHRPTRRITRHISDQFINALHPLFLCPDPDAALIKSEEPSMRTLEDVKQKIQDVYRTAIRNLIAEIVPALLRGSSEQSSLGRSQYSLERDEDIVADIQRFAHADDTTLEEYVKNPDTIRAYIDFGALRAAFNCSDRASGITLADLIGSIRTDHHDRTGEWLDDGEVELLVNFEKGNRMILPHVESNRDEYAGAAADDNTDNVEYDFTVIPNFSLIGREGFDTVTPVIAELQPSLQEKRNYFHIFLAGTMAQTGDRTGTQGHWFPIVLYQQKPGTRQYIITDSLGNFSRIGDRRVRTLITMIESAARADTQ